MKISILLTILLVSGAMYAAPLKIGWGTRDLSTDEPIRLAGMPDVRPSCGTAVKPAVTALAIDDGNDCVIFVSADIINVPGWLGKALRREIKKLDPALPLDKLFISGTHTHSNADLGKTEPTETRYREFFLKQCAEAAIEAWNRRAPGKIAYGYDFAAVAFNRRTIYLDDLSQRPSKYPRVPGLNSLGHCKMLGSHNDPKFSHVESMSDPFVQFLFTYDMKDHLTGAIINIPTPSQATCFWRKFPEQSSDLYGLAREMIRRNHGDLFLITQCSAAAESMPNYRFMNYGRAQDRRWQLAYGRQPEHPGEWEAQEAAERIAAAFDRTLSWAGKERFDNLPVLNQVRYPKLTKFKITEENARELKENLEKLENLPPIKGTPEMLKRRERQIEVARNRLRYALETYEKNQKQPMHKSRIQAVRIGDVAFVSMPYELAVDFGKRIQGRSPFVQTFIVQVADGKDGRNYVPTERAVKNGGYGAEATTCQIGPEGGAELVECILKELEQLNAAAPQLQPAALPERQPTEKVKHK